MALPPPPKHLKVTLKGEVGVKYSNLTGIYHLKEIKINGKPFWSHKLKNKAIWYHKEEESWCISDSSAIGSDNFFIVGPFGNQNWPQNISNMWRFKDNHCLIDDSRGEFIELEECSDASSTDFSKGNFLDK